MLSANIYGREMIVTDDKLNLDMPGWGVFDNQVEFFTKLIAEQDWNWNEKSELWV